MSSMASVVVPPLAPLAAEKGSSPDMLLADGCLEHSSVLISFRKGRSEQGSRGRRVTSVAPRQSRDALAMIMAKVAMNKAMQ